jgi:hypothetical protein
MDTPDFSIERRRSTWKNRGYVSKKNLFDMVTHSPPLLSTNLKKAKEETTPLPDYAGEFDGFDISIGRDCFCILQ